MYEKSGLRMCCAPFGPYCIITGLQKQSGRCVSPGGAGKLQSQYGMRNREAACWYKFLSVAFANRLAIAFASLNICCYNISHAQTTSYGTYFIEC